jgi:hypothetical protein
LKMLIKKTMGYQYCPGRVQIDLQYFGSKALFSIEILLELS